MNLPLKIKSLLGLLFPSRLTIPGALVMIGLCGMMIWGAIDTFNEMVWNEINIIIFVAVVLICPVGIGYAVLTIFKKYHKLNIDESLNNSHPEIRSLMMYFNYLGLIGLIVLVAALVILTVHFLANLS